MRLECVKRKPFSRARSRCVFSHDPLILWRGGESHDNIRMRSPVLYIPHFCTSYVHTVRLGDCPTEGDFPQKDWVWGYMQQLYYKNEGFPHIHVFCKKVALTAMMRGFPYLLILSPIHFSFMPCSVNMCERSRVPMWLSPSPSYPPTLLPLPSLPSSNEWSWRDMPTGSILICGCNTNITTQSRIYTSAAGRSICHQWEKRGRPCTTISKWKGWRCGSGLLG